MVELTEHEIAQTQANNIDNPNLLTIQLAFTGSQYVPLPLVSSGEIVE